MPMDTIEPATVMRHDQIWSSGPLTNVVLRRTAVECARAVAYADEALVGGSASLTSMFAA